MPIIHKPNQLDNAIEMRRQRVADLLIRKVPQYEIASQLGVSTATITKDVKALKAEWRERAQQDVATIVSEEMAKLDQDEAAIRALLDIPIPQTGNPMAMWGVLNTWDRILKIMERRAKLLGLDAPTKIDLEASIRQIAVERGLDPERVVVLAKSEVKALGPGK